MQSSKQIAGIEKSFPFKAESAFFNKQLSLPISQKSPFFEEYMETMKLYYLVIMQNANAVKKSLQKSGIEELQSNFYGDIDLKIFSESINREIVVLKATWGFFSTIINILNIKGENIKHGAQLQNGKFGCIYKRSQGEKQFAIKCVPLTSQSTRKKVIQEYFIMKIASAAHFGPKVTAYYGFDILMFQSCAEFCIELCETAQTDFFQQSKLYLNLTLMHFFHIVHLDIKPANMMFSPFYKKMVFIDFGLSRFVQEEVGFKSITGFEGSLSYCSQQMKKCFIEDRQLQVDLYFNDLSCLNKSIHQIKAAIQMKQGQDKNNFKEERYNYHENQDNYYDLYFLKFFLFSLKTQECLTYLNSLIKLDLKKSFRTQLLQFLMELPPCKKLKDFFFAIVDETLTETDLFSKIKLIYETGQQRLCSIELLRDDEKRNIFLNYNFYVEQCDEIKSIKSLDVRQLASAELMLNPKEIKQIPFKKYVGLYLEYMSYLNNKYNINANQREKAAIIYYQLFIFPEISLELTGRMLIKKTIQHIFKWIMITDQFKEDKDNFALTAFRVLDFLIILFSQSSQQLIKMMSSLYNHSLLTQVHKNLLLLRVSHCSFLIIFRLFSRAQQARLTVSNKCYLWAKTQVDKQLFLRIKNQIIQNYKLQKKEKANWISHQFMQEFGAEIIEEQIIRDNAGKEKLQKKYLAFIELFNRLNVTKKHVKFYYFLFEVYDSSFINENNLSLCKKMYNIVKNNFRDDSLLQQFIFQVHLKVLYLIKQSTSRKINGQIVTLLSNQIKKVNKSDLVLFNHLFLDNILKLQYSLRREKFLESSTNEFLNKLYDSLEDYFSQELYKYEEQTHFFHVTPNDLTKLFKLALKIYPCKVDEMRNKVCNSSLLEKIQCAECRNYVSFYSKILSFQNYFFLYCSSKNKNNKQSCLNLYTILQKYVAQSKLLEQEILRQKKQALKSKFLLKILLDLKLQFCKYDTFLEQKCHGIEEYFNFSLKYNSFFGYFQINLQCSDAIFSTMLFLFQTNYNQFITFLIKLVQVLEQSLLPLHCLIINTYFSVFLKQDKKLADKIFADLQNYCKSTSRKTAYIVVLYAILFKLSESKKIQNKIAAEIMQVTHKLHVHFQRKIQIILLTKVLDNIRALDECKFNRQFIYCNNKLLKLLMIEGKTKAVPIISGDSKIASAIINSKISKIQKMSSKQLHLKFKKKPKRTYC